MVENKVDGKKLIKMIAEKTGMNEADIRASLLEGESTPAAATKPESDWAVAIKALADVGEDDAGDASEWKEIRKMMMQMKVLNLMMPAMGGQQQEAPRPQQPDISEILAKNDEKWERRLAAMEAKQEKENMQRQLDQLTALVREGGGKKSEAVLDELKGLREKIESDKEIRFQEQLQAKTNEIAQLREDFQTNIDNVLDAINNKEPPQSAIQQFSKAAQDFKTFRSTIREAAIASGMTDKEADIEVAKSEPVWKTALGTLERLLPALTGKELPPATEEGLPAEEQQPEIRCRGCGLTSDNGTEYCSTCRAKAAQQRRPQPEPEPDNIGDAEATVSPATEESL